MKNSGMYFAVFNTYAASLDGTEIIEELSIKAELFEINTGIAFHVFMLAFVNTFTLQMFRAHKS